MTCWKAGAALLLASVAHGGTIVPPLEIRSESADRTVYADGLGFDTLTYRVLYVGQQSATLPQSAGVLIFSLSGIPIGMEVATATLSFQAVKSSTPPTFSASLYGLGLRETAEVETSDFATPGTLIKSAALDPSAVYKANTLYTISDVALADYINDQISSSIGLDYLYLRFSADATATGGQNYQIGSGDLGAKWTFLTLTLRASSQVPEPATAGLMGIGAAVLLTRRHRSKWM